MPKRAFRPAHALIVAACAVAVVFLVMAIAQVAREQVSKGASLQHKMPHITQTNASVYSTHGGARVADLDANLTPAHFKQ